MASTQPLTDFGQQAGYKPLPDRTLTEEEFVAWCGEDTKAEWVDGQVVMMSPANYSHANLTAFLLSLLRTWVEDHGMGLVLGPEFATRLSPRSRRVPDLMFIAKERLRNLRPTHLEGPPDLVMEIVSPDSVERDWREKFADYQAAGVQEYWIIDPAHQRVEAYQVVGGAYQSIVHDQGRIASTVLAGFFLREEWLWQEQLPKVRDTLKEIETSSGTS